MRLKYLFILAALTLSVSAHAQAHSASIKWTASIDTGVTYNVYRLIGSCPTTVTGFTKITSSVSVLTFIDSTVTAGNYCYYVTSSLNGAESVPSNLASAVILPAAPTAVSITGTN